jgi:hypothetical protein
MIRFKKIGDRRKRYHQVFVDNRVVGTLQKTDGWWTINRFQGYESAGGKTKTEAAQKLIEARIGSFQS